MSSEAAVAGLIVWLEVEVASQLVGHPVSADGEPLRPPISLSDYLLYNPGVVNA